MDHLELRELLRLFQEKGYTETELNRLWKFLSDERNEEDIKNYLNSELKEFNPEFKNEKNVDFKKIFKNIQNDILVKELTNNEGNKHLFRKKAVNQMLRIAAVLLIGLFVGYSLTYILPQKQNQIKETYTLIKAPYGARTIVTLPDGSSVWVNAGSSIRYKNSFNSDTRTIQLDGEAYFKVAKNKKIPFIVNAGGVNVVAVGTEFNVKAYSDEDLVETTLVEGKVKIQDNSSIGKDKKQISLEPMQKAVFWKNKSELLTLDVNTIDKNKINSQSSTAERLITIIPRIDPQPIIAWKDNKLIIRGEEMSRLAIKLERKYDVKITFVSKNIKDYKFSGTLEDETLTQVLDVIKLTAPIDYVLEGKEVKIYENESMARKFKNYLKQN